MMCVLRLSVAYIGPKSRTERPRIVCTKSRPKNVYDFLCLVYHFIVLLYMPCPPALRDIFHTRITQYSVFVVKVSLNTNQLTDYLYWCLLWQVPVSKPAAQSPRVLPPLPSSADNPDISRSSSSKSTAESGVVSVSVSNAATDASRVPSERKPAAAVSKSSSAVETSRVFTYFLLS